MQPKRIIVQGAPLILLACLCALLTTCNNSPYPAGDTATNTLYCTYFEIPTKMDPAQAYYTNEYDVIQNIYEAPLAYDFLKRPFELIPQTAEAIPTAEYFDKAGNKLNDADPPSEQVARAEYTVHLKHGVMYADHPCFARDAQGKPYYMNVTDADLRSVDRPMDFPHQGTRELHAADYALGMRRLADPRVACPVIAILNRSIAGLEDLGKKYNDMIEAERARRRKVGGALFNEELDEKRRPIHIDLMAPEFPGVQVVDDYTFKIVLSRKYPQIRYWMAMAFLSPIPQEALDFYEQTPVLEKQMTLMRYPVGTGPFAMEESNANRQVILRRNTHYHDDFYPKAGAPGDAERGLLADAGKKLPFADRVVMTYEVESPPRWNKFLQGYLDFPMSPYDKLDSFDNTVQIKASGEQSVSPVMSERGVRLEKEADQTVWFFSFNMVDPVVGGYDEAHCKLRQAIAIALDSNEYIDLFRYGIGVPAESPIPPGVAGYTPGPEGVDPYTDEWDAARQRPRRKSIEVAKKLLAEAGFPNGRKPDGTPLTIGYDHQKAGIASFQSEFIWTRDRFDKLGIVLLDRGTDLARVREKFVSGNWQFNIMGWSADYPDPENFLAIMYGGNGRMKFGGENNGNYANPKFDELYRKIETMEPSPERMDLVKQMIDISRHDAPWAFFYNPVQTQLQQPWMYNGKLLLITRGNLKYVRIDPAARAAAQEKLNKPVIWPVALFYALCAALYIYTLAAIHHRQWRARPRAAGAVGAA